MESHVLPPSVVVFFDGLRFALAILVVVGHGFGYFFGYWGGFFPSKFPHIQSIAVVGFFFVSGFLVTHSVMLKLKRGAFTLNNYLIDRFSRIYCSLIPCLLFVLAIDSAFLRIFPGYDFAGSLSPSVFGNNLLLIPGLPLGSMRPIWSLMFEWWIYILFGGLVFFTNNKIVGAVAIALGTYYTFFINGRGEGGQLAAIWAVGALSAIFFTSVSKCTLHLSWVTALFLGSAATIYALSSNAFDLLAGTLFSLGLLALGAHLGKKNVAPSHADAFRFLAGYSYTLFLTHYTVLYWFQKAGWSGISGFVLSIFTANLVAIAIARYTERNHKAVSRLFNGFLLRRSAKA